MNQPCPYPGPHIWAGTAAVRLGRMVVVMTMTPKIDDVDGGFNLFNPLSRWLLPAASAPKRLFGTIRTPGGAAPAYSGLRLP